MVEFEARRVGRLRKSAPIGRGGSREQGAASTRAAAGAFPPSFRLLIDLADRVRVSILSSTGSISNQQRQNRVRTERSLVKDVGRLARRHCP